MSNTQDLNPEVVARIFQALCIDNATRYTTMRSREQLWELAKQMSKDLIKEQHV